MFKSHCAPEPPAEAPGSAAALSKLAVAALKAQLQALGQPINGRKVRCIFLQEENDIVLVHKCLRTDAAQRLHWPHSNAAHPFHVR